MAHKISISAGNQNETKHLCMIFSTFKIKLPVICNSETLEGKMI